MTTETINLEFNHYKELTKQLTEEITYLMKEVKLLKEGNGK